MAKTRKQKNTRKLKRSVVCLEAMPTWGFVEAAEGDDSPKLRTFKMTAYTGAPIRQWWSRHPIILDLQGMKTVRGSIPVLRDHDRQRIVGHTDAATVGDTISISGIISGVGKDAEEIAGTSLNNFPWQASIGASISKVVFLKEGKTAIVNGKEITGPMNIARRSALDEVSFVVFGADSKTSASVAASATSLDQEVYSMKFEQYVKARGFELADLSEEQRVALQADFDKSESPEVKATKTPEPTKKIEAGEQVDAVADMTVRAAAEAKRIADVTLALAKHPTLLAKAIEDKWNANEATLQAKLADRPAAPAIQSHGATNTTTSDLECALALSADATMAEADYGAEACTRVEAAGLAGPNRQLGIGEVLLIAAQRNGGYTGRNARDVRAVLQAAYTPQIQASGLSTIDISGILSNVGNKFLLAGYNAVEDIWRRIATIRNVRDFKEVTSYRMIGDEMYDIVAPGGEIKHGKLAEESYGNKADTYARMFGLSRTDIINDDLGALTDIPRRLGRSAGLKVNDVFWTVWLDDADFFKTDNNNLITTALSSAGLKAGVLKFRRQTDPDGFPIGLTPSLLLVPPELEVDADELFVSTNINTGGSSSVTKVPNRNVHAAKYEPIVSTYLSNSSYTGFSLTGWYLLPNPEDLSAIEVAFLNGVQTPTIESADADFNQLGIQMRGFHDFGVRKQEPRAAIKSSGGG